MADDALLEALVPLKRRARMSAQALRGLPPEEMDAGAETAQRDADILSGIGSALSGYGDRAIDSNAAQTLRRGSEKQSMAQEARRFSLSQALEAQRDARRRQEHLADRTSDRIYQTGRDKINDENALEQARTLSHQKRLEKVDEKAAADQAKKQESVVELEDRFGNIKANIARLRGLIEDGGTYEMFGSHDDLMNQALGDLAIDDAKVKDPKGVVRDSDVKLAKQNLPRVGLSQKNQTAMEVLNNYEKSLEGRRVQAYRVRGLTLPDDGTTAPAPTVNEDAQALEWAKANAGTPKGQAILKLHGAK